MSCSDSDTLDATSESVDDEARKPNVVFVLTDQWRAQATGYSGDSNLIGKTPNLDRIADSGINFRNAISTTPVCTPYRAALLTGQYPTTTGMIFNDLHLPEESYTMAEMFKESGYATAYIGKWHLDGMMRDQFTPPERRQGFEYWKALECSHEYNELFYYEAPREDNGKDTVRTLKPTMRFRTSNNMPTVTNPFSWCSPLVPRTSLITAHLKKCRSSSARKILYCAAT